MRESGLPRRQATDAQSAGPRAERTDGDSGVDAITSRTMGLRALTETLCPACGATLHHEKCKVVCRSRVCVHRIVYNCAEF